MVGIEPQLPTDWLTSAVPGMTSEFNSGDWNSDDLLGWCVNNKQAFWWQSHTLTHLARDNLGESDCTIEDGGEFYAAEGSTKLNEPRICFMIHLHDYCSAFLYFFYCSLLEADGELAPFD